MAPPSTETTGHPARQRQQQQPLLPYHHHHHHHHHYHHHHSHDPSPNTRLANNANYAGANSSSRTAAFQPHPNAPMYTNGGTSSTSFGERNGSNNNNNPHNGGLNLRLPSRMLEVRLIFFFSTSISLAHSLTMPDSFSHLTLFLQPNFKSELMRPTADLRSFSPLFFSSSFLFALAYRRSCSTFLTHTPKPITCTRGRFNLFVKTMITVTKHDPSSPVSSFKLDFAANTPAWRERSYEHIWDESEE